MRNSRTIAAFVAVTLLAGLCLALPLWAGSSLPAHPDKLVVTQRAAGTGIVATKGMQVKVLYTAWLYDPSQPHGRGKKFDGTSAGHPLTFTMGDPRLIAGWRQGMVGMRVGGRRELLIPARLAYGSKGKGAVPPNTALVFDIRLVDASPSKRTNEG